MTFNYTPVYKQEEPKEKQDTYTLGEHQINAINHFCNNPFGILAMATGTGKSLTILSTMLAQIQKKTIDKGLICCTLGSIDEVKDDCKKFYNYIPIDIKNIEDLFKWINSNKYPIALTRYEWLKNFMDKLLQNVMSIKKIGVAFDEAQRLKQSGQGDISKATKTAYFSYALTRKAASLIAITATPVTVSLDDLYGIMYIVNKNILGNYYDFCKEFYERKLEPLPYITLAKICKHCGAKMIYSDGYNICTNPKPCLSNGQRYMYRVKSQYNIIGYKNYNKLAAKLKNNMFCFFPEQDIKFHTVSVDLSAESWQIYQEIVNDTIKYIKYDENGNAYSSDDPTPWGTRRLQLQYAVDKSPEKLQALIQTLKENLNKGCVIYIHYHESIAHVVNELNLQRIEYKLYTGKQSKRERGEAKAWFRKNPQNKVLIISQAGGASLNLQVTDTFIYYSQPDTFGTYSQSLGRIVRMYSKFKTFHVYFINAKDAIDVCKMQWFLAHKKLMYEIFNNKLIPENIPSLELSYEVRKWLKDKYLWLKY